MLKIKLARFGRRGQPHYRIVVNEARSKRDGKYMALLGQYAPAQQPKILEIDMKAFAEWLKKGAQPTETVAALYKRFQTKNPFPVRKPQPSKKQLAKKAAQEKTQAEEKAAVKPEAPAETKEAASTPKSDVASTAEDTKPSAKTTEALNTKPVTEAADTKPVTKATEAQPSAPTDTATPTIK